MLGKKIGSFKKLAKKVKVNMARINDQENKKKCELSSQYEESLLSETEEQEESSNGSSSATTPNGYFAVYVGEERERFVVPTSYLNHPLLKMLMEKSYSECAVFAEQKCKLVVPCSVSTFQEVISAVECCNGRFDFGDLVEEFI